ncbi:hypothetical protein BGZ94_003850 [Podila epigama]|nr:hypothetical protein BGZ94_003850 [Podila epigama]
MNHDILVQTAKQEENEKFERVGAKLRQSYSRLDKNRQGRSVIVDPNLRLPKAPIRATSGWSNTGPKKPKSLFEKARMQARRISQMYSTGPIPAQIRNASTGGTVRSTVSMTGHSAPRLGQTHTSSSISTGIKPGSRHLIAPNSVFAPNQHNTINNNNSRKAASGFIASRNSRGPMETGLIALTPTTGTTATPTKARYSYKVRPVVYMNTPRLNLSSKQSDSGSRSPTRTSQISPPIPATAPGAIADFFKQYDGDYRWLEEEDEDDGIEQDVGQQKLKHHQKDSVSGWISMEDEVKSTSRSSSSSRR